MTEETRDEQTEDRYYLEVGDGEVLLIDGQDSTYPLRSFAGPDRLLRATGVMVELNETGAPSLAAPIRPPGTLPILDPSRFLTVTLPAVARIQRLESALAEAKEIEDRALELMRLDAEILSRATVVRTKLEKALSRLLSATQGAETPAVRGTDTPKPAEAL